MSERNEVTREIRGGRKYFLHFAILLAKKNMSEAIRGGRKYFLHFAISLAKKI